MEENKLLPDQVYGLKQREERLRRQLPWSRQSEYLAWQAGGEKPPEFKPEVSFIPPIEEKVATRIDPEMKVRIFAQRAKIIEVKQTRLKREMTQKRLAEKQSFFNKMLPMK